TRPVFWLAAIGALVLALITLVRFSRWLDAIVLGSDGQWRDAYADEVRIPNARERQRLQMAWAMAESEPPVGLPEGPRVHKPGTLARLRYEAVATGDRWDVRALVPPPVVESLTDCPAACQDIVARSGGLLLARTGDPGLAAEWVLRMPVGRTFDLGSRAIVTQDLLDPTPRTVPLTALRVTLVDVCHADVRVASVGKLLFHDNAIVPIPKEYRVSRWLQMNGCGPLERLPSAPARTVERHRVEVPEPTPGALVLRQAAETGYAWLDVDEAWLARHATPVVFLVHALCRFDADGGTWRRIATPGAGVATRVTLRDADAPNVDRTAARLPEETALFWIAWSEHDDGERSARAV